MTTLLCAIKDFLIHCEIEKKLSTKTLKAYGTDLNQFYNFIQSKKYDIEIIKITRIELREYLVFIGHLKPKSIKRKIATMKALFNYLESEDTVSINPFRKMRINIKEPKRLPFVMDIKEISKIFTVAYKYKDEEKDTASFSHFSAMRNTVIVELLFTTGARVSEIANLKTCFINTDTGSITIKGKGDKERGIQICNKETLTLLKQYHKLYNKKIEAAGNYFLINRLNKKLSEQSIRAVVKKLSGEAKISKHITPHMFRHSFATLLLEKDVDIKYIQSLLGHSSIMTTQIYTHVNREKQRQILRTKHPRKDFSMTNSGGLNEG